jgi:nuclear-control-of-ATPase protein 2
MSLFAAPAQSYAQEQLSVHLTSLTTLPVDIPASELKATAEPSLASDRLQHAISELIQAKPPTLARLGEILQSLSKEDVAAAEVSDLDREAEAEVVTRAVSLIWAHVMEVFVNGALRLEDDRSWWDYSASSRMGTVIYLVQSE